MTSFLYRGDCSTFDKNTYEVNDSHHGGSARGLGAPFAFWTINPPTATLYLMRILFVVAGLLLLMPGCGAPGARTVKVATGRPAVRADVPSRLVRKSYPRHREIYDTLPLDSPDRAAYRDVLVRYLVKESSKRLSHQKNKEALDYLFAALTLYAPSEVFSGKLRQPSLAALSRKIASRFAPLGDAGRVVLVLCVQISLGAREKQREYQQISAWLDETRMLVRGSYGKGARMISIMEGVVKVWPSRFVVGELHRLYLQQVTFLTKASARFSAMRVSASFPVLGRTGSRVARLYLRVGRPKEALRKLKALPVRSNVDRMLRAVLKRLTSTGAKVEDYLQLVQLYAKDDPQNQDVALAICRAARRRFPDLAAAHLCIAQYARAMDRPRLALRSMQEAMRREPNSRIYANSLARQYQEYLQKMALQERLGEAGKLLQQVETYYQRMEKKFGGPMQPSLSAAYRAMGEGYYNAGQIDKAGRMFWRSLGPRRVPSEALIHLTQIQLNRGEVDQALKFLERTQRELKSLRGPSIRPFVQLYWMARLEQVRARALWRVNRAEESKKAFSRLAGWWQKLRYLERRPEFQAEALVYEAKALFAVGEKGRAVDALEHAVDLAPGRYQTYFDAIAVLSTHGHLPEALSIYHRAMRREEVKEYHKSYCSFWIIGMARRAKVEPDSQALEHLDGLTGNAWHSRLARLVQGKVSYKQLLKEAKSIGSRAELFYYWADLLVARGKMEQARQMWKKVLQTEMMGFYEYRMAQHNLQHGPARIITRSLERKRVQEQPLPLLQ